MSSSASDLARLELRSLSAGLRLARLRSLSAGSDADLARLGAGFFLSVGQGIQWKEAQ